MIIGAALWMQGFWQRSAAAYLARAEWWKKFVARRIAKREGEI